MREWIFCFNNWLNCWQEAAVKEQVCSATYSVYMKVNRVNTCVSHVTQCTSLQSLTTLYHTATVLHGFIRLYLVPVLYCVPVYTMYNSTMYSHSVYGENQNKFNLQWWSKNFFHVLFTTTSFYLQHKFIVQHPAFYRNVFMDP